MIPPAIQAGLVRYANDGIAPGSCLRAILEGDLFAAFARADPQTTAAMPKIVTFIRTRLNPSIYGSPDAVSRYIEEMRPRPREAT